MQIVSQLTSLLVLTGALFLGASILLAHKVKGQIPDALMPQWRIVIGLMYFFLAGYAIFIIILIRHFTVPTEIITGPVFLGGAFFVYIVISLTRKAIVNLKAGEENLLRLNESLERLVKERTHVIERYASELATSNEELKSFIYSISHDLRSPLVNIKGFSAELGGTMKEFGSLVNNGTLRLSEGEREHLCTVVARDVPAALSFINLSVDRIDVLINSFLKLSHIGRRNLKWETIDMNELVRTTLDRFAREIEEKKVCITVGDLPRITADWAAIGQVVDTLLDNALKYLVSEREGIVEIRGERTTDETIFHVRDNGRGIAEDDIAKVFDLFRRAGRQDVPGVGMGLAYAKSLLRRHDGRIWCESVIGSGTRFSFAVPQGAASAE